MGPSIANTLRDRGLQKWQPYICPVELTTVTEVSHLTHLDIVRRLGGEMDRRP